MVKNNILGYFLKKNDLVFDVGSHEGKKTEIFLQRGAKVVCFEPQPACVEKLLQKFGNIENVIIVQKGLADKPGKMQLSICSVANAISTLSEEWKKGRFADYKWDQTIQVDVTTLDEIIKQYGLPKYCKIDVEGFEYQVIQGLHKPIPYLSFEFTSEFLDNAKKCIQYLQGIGYNEFNVVLGEDDHFKFSNWVNRESLFSFIERESLNDNLLWGDIYTRNNVASQDEKGVNSNGSNMKKGAKLNKERSILYQIQQAELWSEGKPLRLHLGCGEQHFEGYVNIDYPPSEHTVQTKTGADIFADITTLNFPDQSVDEIRLHHVFEHFSRPRALALLIKWHEWLKIGGKLHIETPDIIGCANLLVSKIPYRVKQAIIRHCFGSHETDWAYHYDGWYDAKYHYILRKLGFNVECRSWHWENEPFLSNVESIATKYVHMSRENLISAGDEILKDSMVADVSSEREMYGIWCREMRSFI